jgi:hypothetical protein
MLNGMDGNSRRTAASQPRSTEADERPETINIESVIDDVEVTPMMGRDLLQLMLAGARRIAPLVQTPHQQGDSRWNAGEHVCGIAPTRFARTGFRSRRREGRDCGSSTPTMGLRLYRCAHQLCISRTRGPIDGRRLGNYELAAPD